MDYVQNFFEGAKKILDKINVKQIDLLAHHLENLRISNGRLFIIGVGGSAANCSHAVNDFRKICKIQAYTPTDNVAELTARTNDEGWDTTFSEWIACSQGNNNDAVLVFSVGGGNAKYNVSTNIVKAIDEAKSRNMKIFGIVGRDGGYTLEKGDCVVVIPTVFDELITPYSESFQSIIWHCLTCHPKLSQNKNKWESIDNKID